MFGEPAFVESPGVASPRLTSAQFLRKTGRRELVVATEYITPSFGVHPFEQQRPALVIMNFFAGLAVRMR